MICGKYAFHRSSHWRKGKPCPRWNAPDSGKVRWDKPEPAAFWNNVELAIANKIANRLANQHDEEEATAAEVQLAGIDRVMRKIETHVIAGGVPHPFVIDTAVAEVL